MILRACRRILANEERLSALDAACGDGDHGVSMARGFRAVAVKLESEVYESPAALLRAVGMTLVSSIGGATGPLMGTLFLEAGKALAGGGASPGAGRGSPAGGAGASAAGHASPAGGVDTRSLAAAFRGGLEGVRRRGGAAPGEKTMVDALLPAVEALEAAAEAADPPNAALARAARAARAGAEATSGMVARQGKARYLGQRAVGHEDAGANSIAFIFEAFAEDEEGPREGRRGPAEEEDPT